MWSTSPARVCLGWGPDHPAGRGIRHHQLAHTFHGCRARYLRGRRPHNPATEATTPGPRPPCCRLASALGFVRFRIRSAAAASAQAGFDATRPCLVVWIGVSAYLTRTAIDRTLADLTSMRARGSLLVTDHGDPETVTGTHPLIGARRTARLVRRRGEPWRTALSRTELTHALNAVGFSVRDHARVPELAKRYAPNGRPWCFTDDWLGVLNAESLP